MLASNWLVKNAGVARFILLYDGDEQRDKFMPELETLYAVRSVVDRGFWRLGCRCRLLVRLELSLVQLDAVVKEELVGRPGARLDAIFHHCTSAWRTWQLLNLQWWESVRHL